MKKIMLLKLKENKPLFFVVIDNLRLDQWEMIEPLLSDYFNVENEDTYYSILPTTTAYSRNALFSGMMPQDMAKFYPELWEGEDTDEGKNNHEEEFLKENLKRNRLNIKSSYSKILQASQG